MTQIIVKLRFEGLAIDAAMDLSAHEIQNGLSFDTELARALIHILRPGDVALDGGANIGCVSLVMAALVGERGKVVALEPEECNLLKLRRNVALNHVPQLEVIARPLWSAEEQVTLFLSKDSGQHSLSTLHARGDGSYSTLPAITIDALKLPVRLIKLDIEGAEVEALKGATRSIERARPFVLCEMNPFALACFNESPSTLRRLAKERFGYDTFLLDKFYPYPVLLPPSVALRTNVQNINVLLATPDMVAEAFPTIDVIAPEAPTPAPEEKVP